MITITLYKRSGKYLRATSEGHADFSEEGTDIVCAGVSTLMYSVAETLMEEYQVPIAIEDGFMDIDVSKHDAPEIQTIMKVLEYGVKGVERQYPTYVKLQSKEDRHVTI